MGTQKYDMLEPFLQLKQPLYNLKNIDKIEYNRIAPVQGNNNLDGGQQIFLYTKRWHIYKTIRWILRTCNDV